jgi:putative two-component system hydrogenase maturation factor HypX/HoxX
MILFEALKNNGEKMEDSMIPEVDINLKVSHLENELKRVLLICTRYNSLTQRTHVELLEREYDVSIELAINDKILVEAVELYRPNLIIAPYLTTVIPEKIWRNNFCFVVHPGIKGSRGLSPVDWAIALNLEEWGVTVFQADAELGAGSIWASSNFKMRPVSKSELYRREITEATVDAILQAVENFKKGNYIPEPLDYEREDVKGHVYPAMQQYVRAIDWQKDSTQTILRKIRGADSQPGVLDSLGGLGEFYLYGAHPEDKLVGEQPGKIIAQRYGAICISTRDGAIWISHLKDNKPEALKLPATQVLGDHLQNVSESQLPLEVSAERQTFKEVWYEEKYQVGYLNFDFYNGVVSTEQCKRLKEAFVFACSRQTKVIVLTGSRDFFASGIDLNTIEAAQNPTRETWNNIRAFNDLIYTVIATTTHFIISAMEGNASAEGVMLALSADLVYARKGIVLNPHYRQLEMYGSGFWTYLLPERIGLDNAIDIVESYLPISAREAERKGLIDYVIEDNNIISFRQQIQSVAEEVARSPDLALNLIKKKEKRASSEEFKPLWDYWKEEAEQIKIGVDCGYYDFLRHKFVYKIMPNNTPLYLAKHRQILYSL